MPNCNVQTVKATVGEKSKERNVECSAFHVDRESCPDCGCDCVRRQLKCSIPGTGVQSMQGRHFILICGGVRGLCPRRGSRGQSPLVGVRGRSPLKPQRFWHFKGVPDMYYCGYYDEIPKTIVLC